MNIGVQQYGVFVPYKVEVNSDEVGVGETGRKSYIFTDEAVDLIKSNPGEWFVIHETEIEPMQNSEGKVAADRQRIMSKRSTYYAAAKYATSKVSGLEYTVNGITNPDTKEHVVRLIVRVND
ncbi:MAG: hypothetical protein VW522_09910 [Candidatus Neomarinimicrobiota bacterium]